MDQKEFLRVIKVVRKIRALDRVYSLYVLMNIIGTIALITVEYKINWEIVYPFYTSIILLIAATIGFFVMRIRYNREIMKEGRVLI